MTFLKRDHKPSSLALFAAIGALTLALAGCGTDAKKSATTGTTAPPTSDVTSGPAEHVSSLFFSGQLKLRYGSGWTYGEDSPGEFSIRSPQDPDLRVIVWKDIYPTVSKHGLDRLAGVAPGAHGLLTWLRKNPSLVVSNVQPSTIGASLPAIQFDVSLAANAVNDDPQCPERSCVNFLGWPGWDEPYGMAGDSVTRFYVADTTLGTEPRLVVAAIEATSAEKLRAQLHDARAIIRSIQLPVAPA